MGTKYFLVLLRVKHHLFSALHELDYMSFQVIMAGSMKMAVLLVCFCNKPEESHIQIGLCHQHKKYR